MLKIIFSFANTFSSNDLTLGIVVSKDVTTLKVMFCFPREVNHSLNC